MKVGTRESGALSGSIWLFPSLEWEDCTGIEVLFYFAGSGGKERVIAFCTNDYHSFLFTIHINVIKVFSLINVFYKAFYLHVCFKPYTRFLCNFSSEKKVCYFFNVVKLLHFPLFVAIVRSNLSLVSLYTSCTPPAL